MIAALHMLAAGAAASDFSEPWKRQDRALVIDAYEYNPIDWQQLVSDKRIVGFINKASDGLPPPYFCKGSDEEVRLCKTLWRRHAVAQELFQTRRMLAKTLGLKWGAYHLARPGNPIEQADNFLQFAKPDDDDLMALDIEENDPTKWMSLADAEIFVEEIRRRTGRYPILYTNGTTAKYIADNLATYPTLSRLPLWYARYKPEIGMHFPKGNWQSYALWQFSAQANCNARACPYRVAGAKSDIDVNVATVDADTLRRAWPFGGLLGAPVDPVANVPIPVARADALEGDVDITFASVHLEPGSIAALAYAFMQAGNRYPAPAMPEPPEKPEPAVSLVAYAATTVPAGHFPAIDRETEPQAFRDMPVDPVTTASVEPKPSILPFRRGDFPVFLLKPLSRPAENFEDLFGRPRQHHSMLADDNRPVDQDRLRQHEIDQLLVAPFRVVEAQVVIGRVLAP